MSPRIHKTNVIVLWLLSHVKLKTLKTKNKFRPASSPSQSLDWVGHKMAYGLCLLNIWQTGNLHEFFSVLFLDILVNIQRLNSITKPLLDVSTVLSPNPAKFDQVCKGGKRWMKTCVTNMNKNIILKKYSQIYLNIWINSNIWKNPT